MVGAPSRSASTTVLATLCLVQWRLQLLKTVMSWHLWFDSSTKIAKSMMYNHLLIKNTIRATSILVTNCLKTPWKQITSARRNGDPSWIPCSEAQRDMICCPMMMTAPHSCPMEEQHLGPLHNSSICAIRYANSISVLIITLVQHRFRKCIILLFCSAVSVHLYPQHHLLFTATTRTVGVGCTPTVDTATNVTPTHL